MALLVSVPTGTLLALLRRGRRRACPRGHCSKVKQRPWEKPGAREPCAQPASKGGAWATVSSAAWTRGVWGPGRQASTVLLHRVSAHHGDLGADGHSLRLP